MVDAVHVRGHYHFSQESVDSNRNVDIAVIEHRSGIKQDFKHRTDQAGAPRVTTTEILITIDATISIV